MYHGDRDLIDRVEYSNLRGECYVISVDFTELFRKFYQLAVECRNEFDARLNKFDFSLSIGSALGSF